jgi:putative tryptophan/tyrosine transport system substrate-binding protein
MRRREFIAGLGAIASAWPPIASAQDKMPVIGFLHVGSPAENAKRLDAFWKSLGDAGFVEGRNVLIEYRWAEGHTDRLDGLAADLVRRQVTVIVTVAVTAAAVAAKKATNTIPIVFAVGTDPVALGLVASLSHPGGNATGVTSLNASLAAKRLELARELAPKATRFFTLINPSSPLSEPFLEGLEGAATGLGLQVDVLRAHSEEEIDAAFASLPKGPGGVFISSPDALFYSWRTQLLALLARHALPSVFDVPEYVEGGGLASYGNDFMDAIRLAGGYVGRILKGEKPADLPVVQAQKFVLAINLTTAKALGIDIPTTLLAAADEVIE